MVVDDHILLRILLGAEPTELRPSGGAVATTGLWYHRLCRALADPTVTGTMSRSLGNVDPAIARAAVGAVIELPDSIELTSLRSLSWSMAQLLGSGARLNLLSLEALAAAMHHDGEICLAVADDNPALRQAGQRLNVKVRLITL